MNVPPGFTDGSAYWARLAAFRQADREREEMVTELVTKYTHLMEQFQQKCDDLENEVASRRMWHKRATEAANNLTDLKYVTRLQEAHPMVFAIIDGDGAIFREELISQGGAGGSQAAHLLQTAIKKHLKEIYADTNVETWNIVVQIVLNQDGLSNKLQSVNLVDKQDDLANFARAFGRTQPLFCFVDVGSGKEQADHKIREMLRVMIRNAQCRHIIFGPCHDNGYIPVLKPYELDSDVSSKITLLETTPAGPGFRQLRFPRAEFPEVFRSQPLPERAIVAPPPPTPSPTILSKGSGSDKRSPAGSYAVVRGSNSEAKVINIAPTKTRPKLPPKFLVLNVDRERLDEPLMRTDPSALKRVTERSTAEGRLCNNFHITGTCKDEDCAYVHGPRVGASEQLVLKHKSRGLRCYKMTGCRDVECPYGHHCRYGRNCDNQHKCRFADTHHVKLTPAVRAYEDGTEEQINHYRKHKHNSTTVQHTKFHCIIPVSFSSLLGLLFVFNVFWWRNTGMGLLEKVLDLQIPRDIRISPDATRVVYTTSLKQYHRVGDNLPSTLWIAQLDTAKSARALTDGTRNDRMPRWSPDGKHLACLSDRAGDPGKTTAIYLQEISGVDKVGEPRALTPDTNEQRISNFEFSPDGKFIAYVKTPERSPEDKAKKKAKDDAVIWGEDWQYARLYLLDVVTGEIDTIFEHEASVGDFSWSDDGSEIAFTTTRTPHAESGWLHGVTISVVSVATRQAREICCVPRAAWSLTWSGSKAYFLGFNDPQCSLTGLAVYAADLAGRDRHAAAAAFERVAHGDTDCAQGLARACGGELLVRVERGLEDHFRFLSGRLVLGTNRVTSKFDVARGGGGEDVLVGSQGDFNAPMEVFAITASGARTQLSDHGGELRAAYGDFCTWTHLQCSTLDGKEVLDNIFLTPTARHRHRSKEGAPLPTMVLVHGGPYARVAPAFDVLDTSFSAVPLLLAEGFGVLLPNYRGGSGRGRRFASYSYGGAGLYDEPDVVAATQDAVRRGLADPRRLVAMGWSQGGYVSYLAAVRNGRHGLGWRFRGVIPGAGITDLDAMVLTSDIGYEQAEFIRRAAWRGDGLPQDGDGEEECLRRALEEERRVRRASPLWGFKRAAEEGRIPAVLMLHGGADTRVPVSQAWGFRRAMEEAGLPFEMVTYPREDHWFKERKHIEDMLTRVVGFVKKDIG
ncbi:uncharacterized protein E0L32_009911 [Thyridium curvatum]|uniref:C3H1-type domain-containing protein n=1 Tax=Thyridium curvatum TaxID=1093900 RepID=A0A507AHM6_9PEZI|nr:uncharacterized protein E0L32_009911 [Thyridium curvatum]TPX08572.1 hypothetical protein E0L32_009911 [Thyridium curvatum]